MGPRTLDRWVVGYSALGAKGAFGAGTSSDPMDHTEAVKLSNVERYVLGELNASEREAFEEHYFECVDCAAEVKATAAFIDNMRESMRLAEPARQIQQYEFPRGWLGWLQPTYALALIAGLVLILGYQSLVRIPRLERNPLPAAQALPTLSLTTSGTRGDSAVPEIELRHSSAFGLLVDIPANERFASYSCAIRDTKGKARFDIDVSSVQARDAVELFIPGGTLDAGTYQVVIAGKKANEAGAGEELARYPFVIRNIP